MGPARFLASFIGWDLPKARRFDGTETTLYMETIFPLLYVEQKAGWSAMPAAFPNYFQIRDVGRRAVEFVMGLDGFVTLPCRERSSGSPWLTVTRTQT